MTENYARFTTADATAESLPVNPIVDDFRFFRFAPLMIAAEDGDTPTPAVLPRTAINPRVAEALVEQHGGLTRIAVAGGVPFSGTLEATVERLMPKKDGSNGAALLAPVTVDAGLPAVSDPLPTFEFVLYLPYRQTWELLGYSRGELLNSIALAPQEETTIEIFTWDRRTLAREETTAAEEESTTDVSVTDKTSTEMVKEITKNSEWHLDVNANVGLPPGSPIAASLTVDAGTKESIQEKNALTQSDIHEATRKASSRVKNSRQTKVSETHEFGSEQRVTRKLRNSNMSRALTVDYFEILANYRVTTTLLTDEARLCVKTPNLLPGLIDRAFALTHEGVLRQALLSSRYEPGFAAAKKLAAWDRICEVKCLPPCPCEAPAAGGPSEGPELQAVEAAAEAVKTAIDKLRNASAHGLCHIDLFAPAPEWVVPKREFHRYLYRRTAMEALAPRFWNAATEFHEATDFATPARLELFLLAADPQVIDLVNVLYIHLRAPFIVASIVAEVAASGCPNPWAVVTNIGFDDAGLGPAITVARAALAAYKAATAPAPGEGDEEEEPPPGRAPAEFPPKEIAQALVEEAALLSHLRLNESHYREAVWRRLAAGDRHAFLAPFGDLFEFVENEVIGYVGVKAALPFRLERDEQIKAWFEGNVLNNEKLQAGSPPFTITLPARGLDAHIRLGEGEALEDFLVEHRSLDLAQKAADVATAQQRVEQEKLETTRYQKRLDLKQPLLEDPESHDGQAIHVLLEHNETQGAQATPGPTT